jgi:uncharacterized repeat protein (TIGR04076 family)
MPKVKLTITEGHCRCGYHKIKDAYIVDDLCPPICHELWNSIYPNVYVLLNGGNLDYGSTKKKMFEMKCPDNGKVSIRGEIIEEFQDEKNGDGSE